LENNKRCGTFASLLTVENLSHLTEQLLIVGEGGITATAARGVSDVCPLLTSFIDSLKHDAKTLILFLVFVAESHSGLGGG
jgi:hypothetical protein